MKKSILLFLCLLTASLPRLEAQQINTMTPETSISGTELIYTVPSAGHDATITPNLLRTYVLTFGGSTPTSTTYLGGDLNWHALPAAGSTLTLTTTGSGAASYSGGTLNIPTPTIPTTLPPNGSAGGDLGGSYPNPTVTNGAHLGAGTVPNSALVTPFPTTLPPNGSAGGDLGGSYPNPTVTSGAHMGAGTVPNSALVTPVPTTLPPSGTAGGDLGGTYPNPTVVSGAHLGAGTVPNSALVTTPLLPIGSGNTLTSVNGAMTSPSVQSASTTLAAVTRTGATTTLNYDISSLPAGSTVNVPFSDSGFSTGDLINAFVKYPAATASIMFYDGSTSGSLLLGSSGNVTAASVTHHFYFDGTKWNLLSDGSIYTKNVSSGESAAFSVAPNTANGHIVTDPNNLIGYDARTINLDNQTFVLDGSSIDNGYNLSSFTQAWFYLLSKMPWMLNHSAQFVTAATGSSSSANITVTNASGLRPYMFITGLNIPAGDTVASTYTIGSTTVPLTANPTGTVSSATFYSIYDYAVTQSYIGDAGNDVTNSIYYRYFETAGVQLHRPQASATSTAGTGTIAINTSGVVTGTGTAFTTQTPAGSTIYAGGAVYTIMASPTSATAATVSPAPSAAVAAGTSFTTGGDAIGRAVLFTGMTCAYNELRFALNVIQTGTVGIDTSGNVIGSGTTFTNLIPGVTITVNGTYYTVSSISSATAMVVTPAPGTAIATGTAWYDSRTPASCIADLASYATQARSDGFYDVMMTSIINGTTAGGSVSGPQLDTVDNAAYKGGPNAGTGYIPYDRLIDFAPVAPNFNDATSYADGTHPTAAVQQQMAFKANATMIADGSFQNATGPSILRSTTIVGDTNPLTIIQGASGGYTLYDIDSNLTGGHNLSAVSGQALTAKNYMQSQFFYSSSGSNSNYMDTGLPSSGDLLWEFGSGDWQITSSSVDQGYTLYVGGTFDATGVAKFGAAIDPTMTGTTVAGSTSGSAIFNEVFAGTAYKKVVINLSALNGTAAYTFPTAFSTTPVIVNNDAAATTLSSTAVTVTGSTTTRTLVLEGN